MDGWMDDLACSFHTEALIKLLRRPLNLRIEREGKRSLIFQTTRKKTLKCLIRCVTRLKNHASTRSHGTNKPCLLLIIIVVVILGHLLIRVTTFKCAGLQRSVCLDYEDLPIYEHYYTSWI